ncbi:hypothetical protein GWI33_003551 [Rhynchophorus ferrugineus]|uniref:Uncharacterized protein n=1 Tax=Rhynchophorus ferrugineus TaxID=354439 RepID=A0A834LXY7_RHYFE|nr:hypothetical protein GWI33_003551 [Rhynchophorus ferrugineus]
MAAALRATLPMPGRIKSTLAWRREKVRGEARGEGLRAGAREGDAAVRVRDTFARQPVRFSPLKDAGGARRGRRPRATPQKLSLELSTSPKNMCTLT